MDKLKGLFGGSDDKVEAVQNTADEAVNPAQQGAAQAQQAAQQAADSATGLFGGDRAGAEDFVNRVTTGKLDEGYSNEEALAQFQRVAQTATPEQMQRATQQAVSNLDDDQRAEFAKMLQERAGGVDRSGTAAAAGGMAGGAAGGGLDDILGSLMGGGGSGGSGGLGDILGGLMGGGGSNASGGATTGATQGGGGGTDIMDMLGGFMSSTAGKAVIGGIAAFATKELLDKK